MRRFELLALIVLVAGTSCTTNGSRSVVLASANATTKPAAAEQQVPALPAGHPDISKMTTGNTQVETTDRAPAWSVHMRHLMVEPGDAGLTVSDLLAVQNPSDKAWVGTVDGSGKPATFAIVLPPGATDVRTGEGFDDKTRFEDGSVFCVAPMTPGVTKYRLQYTVPFVDGVATVSAVAPAPVQAMIVFYPDDGRKVAATGLDGPQTIDMGKGNQRFFRAGDVAAGTEVKLTVSGEGTAKESTTKPAATGKAPPQFDGADLAKAIGGAGAMIIILLGGALLFVRAPAKKR